MKFQIFFFEAIKDERKLEYIFLLLKSLPQDNQKLLQRLLQFMKKIGEHSSVNKMTLENLATVFGPVLLRVEEDDSPQSTKKLFESISLSGPLVLFFLRNYDDIFSPERKNLFKSIGRAVCGYDADPNSNELSYQNGNFLFILEDSDPVWWVAENPHNLSRGKTSAVNVKLLSTDLNNPV